MRRIDRGMKWQESRNRRLRDLAEIQAYEFEPHMEDAYAEHDGSIECTFGSTGSTITLRKIDSDSIGIFLHGYCGLLAWALHQKTGLPLMVMSVPGLLDGHWAGHAFIKLGDDKFLDITGINSEAEIQQKFGGTLCPPTELSALEFNNLMTDPKYRYDPLQFLDELERLVTLDFADYLIEQHRAEIPVLRPANV